MAALVPSERYSCVPSAHRQQQQPCVAPPLVRCPRTAAAEILQTPAAANADSCCRMVDCYHCCLMSACCSVRTDPLPVCSPGSSSGSVARCCCSVVYMRPAMIPATVHCPHCRHSHRRPPAERGLIKILLDSASLWGCSLYQGIVTNVELLTTVPVFCCTTSPQ